MSFELAESNQPAEKAPVKEASILIECYPGGPVVSDPSKCREIDRKMQPMPNSFSGLPVLHISA